MISNTYRLAVKGDYSQCLQMIERFIQAFPLNYRGYMSLTNLNLRLGRYEETLTPVRETIRLNPTSVGYVYASQGYLGLNRLDEVKTVIQEARDRKCDYPDFKIMLYWIAFLQNDKAGMEANKPESPITRQTLFEGIRSPSGNLSTMLASLPKSAMTASLADELSDFARLLAIAGYSSDAKEIVEFNRNISANWNARGNDAIALALAGDTEEAEKLAAELSQRWPVSTAVQNCYLPSIRAILALHNGKPKEAIDNLRISSPYEMMQETGMIAVYLRGEAYLAAKQGAQAAAEFQKLLDCPIIPFDVLTQVFPHLGLARAYKLQGDMEKARASYREFLTLWKDADPNIPILKQAKAEYGKLQE